MDDDLRKAALEYHLHSRGPENSPSPPPSAWKPRVTSHLAYSPGVAAACDAIVAMTRTPPLTIPPAPIWWASITNGTAVLGLGNIGALAGKPVMEGKAVLFKKFAGIDSFDIEIERAGPGQIHRNRRPAGADLRRHQP